MKQLSKHAPRKTNILDAIRKTSLCLGLIVFILCIGLYAMHRGFDTGLLIAEKESAALSVVDGIQFSDHGIRTNEYFAGKYWYIAWLLAIFLILSFVEDGLNNKISKMILQILIFAPLVLVLYQIWWIFSEKALATSSILWSEPSNILLRDLIPFDWIILAITIGLLIIQVIISANNRR